LVLHKLKPLLTDLEDELCEINKLITHFTFKEKFVANSKDKSGSQNGN